MSSAWRWVAAAGLSAMMLSAAGAQSVTLEQVMSAPFNSDLVAAPAKNAFAWSANVEGRRNLWVAMRAPDGSYSARQLTNYTADDGQEIHDIAWSRDASELAYVRGDSSANPEHLTPNPAHLPHGAEEDVWLIGADGGAPRKAGPGWSPTFSPAGTWIAWFSDGQILYESPADAGTKPPQSVTVYGNCTSFAWSPDGKQLAFVSDRGTHSFIGVFTPDGEKLTYIDPGTGHDGAPMWSPDGRQIAFVRVPFFKDEGADEPHRTGQPWSIRVADVATGQGRAAWTADAGQGSVFRALDAANQVFWMADGQLIFPWEKDGWLHLYAVAAEGGTARLLTPGNFEVENATLSPDRRRVVFSSNENDSERRHIWEVSAASHAPRALTQGEGIETQPAVASDNQTVAVLRSDARIPMRPAVIGSAGAVKDLAPQMIPSKFPAAQMVVPQPVVYSSTDGMKIHADLFLPAGGGGCQKHPAVVFVHGGSQREMYLGWHSMDYYSNAYALNEYLASRGYVVLTINYRSGIGYGMEFREALEYGPTGASEFRDVEGAGLYLRSRCDVEPQHIGIWGGSWGGYLTAMALAHASGLFAAGSDMSGVHDWNIDHAENLQISDTAADPTGRWKLAWESSPMSAVKDWRSPVLLVQGDNDDEVPFMQTLELASMLRQQHVEVGQLIFPDEMHDFLLFRDWMAAYAATAEFFDGHLKGGER